MKNFNYKQSRKIIIQKTFLKKRIFKSCEILEKKTILNNTKCAKNVLEKNENSSVKFFTLQIITLLPKTQIKLAFQPKIN